MKTIVSFLKFNKTSSIKTLNTGFGFRQFDRLNFNTFKFNFFSISSYSLKNIKSFNYNSQAYYSTNGLSNQRSIQTDSITSVSEIKPQFSKPIPRINNTIPEWSHLFFDYNHELTLPIVRLNSFNYSGRQINLPHKVFNNHIRRDIIHKVYHYNFHYNKVTFRRTKSKGMVSGSGAKPFKQKGTGRARQGCFRSPHLKKGGHAFPLKPKTYYYPLNKKVRLMGLKSILTAKLIDNKIIVVDNFNNEKTSKFDSKNIINLLQGNKAAIYAKDSTDYNHYTELFKNEKVLSLTPTYINNVNVKTLVDNEYLVFSEQSLNSFIVDIMDRENKYYEITHKFKNIDEHKPTRASNLIFNFDPYKEIELHTPAIKGSYENILKGKLVPEESQTKWLLFEKKRIEHKAKHRMNLQKKRENSIPNDKKKKKK
jgi:large subunit ribosomal protein L4